MDDSQRSLVEQAKHLEGDYGGFCFGGQWPEGLVVHRPLPQGVTFPNGAQAALLMTFDVEGAYGNGAGSTEEEVANYQRICTHLARRDIKATFFVVGKMAQEHGPQFVEWMWDAGCDVGSHGYVHDLNKRHGGDRVYAGHYGLTENRQQVQDGLAALNALRPNAVRGFRLPYGHFNEYSYQAIAEAGILYTSHVGGDDLLRLEYGAGFRPFQMKLGPQPFPIVEIPLDSQTYDWSMWVADEETNGDFVHVIRKYCQDRNIEFERTPTGAVKVWRQRMLDAIEGQWCLPLLCHPINLTVRDPRWHDPVEEFIFPVIDELAQHHRAGRAWVCTCTELAEFYRQHMPLQ